MADIWGGLLTLDEPETDEQDPWGGLVTFDDAPPASGPEPAPAALSPAGPEFGSQSFQGQPPPPTDGASQNGAAFVEPQEFGGGQATGNGASGMWGDPIVAPTAIPEPTLDLTRREQIANEMALVQPGSKEYSALLFEKGALDRLEKQRRDETRDSAGQKIKAIEKQLAALRGFETTQPDLYHNAGRLRLRLNEELAQAREELKATGGLSKYEQSLEDAPKERNIVSRSIPYRAAESMAIGIAGGIDQTLATAYSEAAGLVGSKDSADRARQFRDDIRGWQQRFADEQSVMDRESVLRGGSTAVRGAATAVGESLVAAGTGGLPALVGYYGIKSAADELANADAEGRTGAMKYGVAGAVGIIEGAATFAGGKWLGSGTGQLAQAGREAQISLADRAVRHLAKKYSIGRPLQALLRAGGGSGAEIIEEVSTTIAEYMARVAGTEKKFNPAELISEIKATAAVAALSGGGAGLIDAIVRPIAKQQEELPKVAEALVVLERKLSAGDKISRGDLIKVGIPSIEMAAGTSPEQRAQLAREFLQQPQEAQDASEIGAVRSEGQVAEPQVPQESESVGGVPSEYGPEAAPPEAGPVANITRPWEMSLEEYGQQVNAEVARWEQAVKESPTDANINSLSRWRELAKNPEPQYRQLIEQQAERVDPQVGHPLHEDAAQRYPDVAKKYAAPAKRPSVYDQVSIESIPEDLTVETDVIRAKTGERIRTKQSARETVQSLEESSTLYRSLMACLEAA